LPPNLKEIPNLMFSQFTGSVTLPAALETIEHKAFLLAKIDKLDFSSTPNLNTIKDRAFEALEITSNNNTLDFSKNL
ncbi:leucine-rich repeat protein, partial [Apibacter sp. B3546]